MKQENAIQLVAFKIKLLKATCNILRSSENPTPYTAFLFLINVCVIVPHSIPYVLSDSCEAVPKGERVGTP